MKPRVNTPEPTHDLFRSRLENILNLCHELILLSDRIDWIYPDQQGTRAFSDKGRFYATNGRPTLI